jgi:predicted dehydrogenase
MSNAEPLRIGMVGAGFIAQVAHLPAFSKTSGCRIVAIADSRPNLLAAVAAKYEIPARYLDHRELLRADIDAVVVSMPRSAQSAIVREVLASGRPVLSEKPLAYTSRVAAELIGLSDRNGARLAVGFMRRCDPGVALFRNTVAEALATGEMGEMLHVGIRDFCGAYTCPIPEHIRPLERRPQRLAEDPVAPSFLAPGMRDAYDYCVNVASHDIDLLRHVLPFRYRPVHFRLRDGRNQTAVLASEGVDVDFAIGPAELGTWEQTIDVYFRRGAVGLRLDCSLAAGSATVTVRRSGHPVRVLRDADQSSAFDQGRYAVPGDRRRCPAGSCGDRGDVGQSSGCVRQRQFSRLRPFRYAL